MRSMRRTASIAVLALAALVLARGGEPLGDWLRELLGPPPPSFTAEGQGDQANLGPCRVRHVIDGDTLDVQCGSERERVRMLRVDTPERNEPGHAQATRALREMLQGREVYLVFESPKRPERGDHGRLLAYVYADGTNLNVEMVRSGWSPYYSRYGRGRFARQFTRAEREARDAARGLWSSP